MKLTSEQWALAACKRIPQHTQCQGWDNIPSDRRQKRAHMSVVCCYKTLRNFHGQIHKLPKNQLSVPLQNISLKWRGICDWRL